MTLKQLHNKNKNSLHCFWFSYSYDNKPQLDMPVFAYCEAHAIALFIEAFATHDQNKIEVTKITLEKTL